jgi:hypothetical protein
MIKASTGTSYRKTETNQGQIKKLQFPFNNGNKTAPVSKGGLFGKCSQHNSQLLILPSSSLTTTSFLGACGPKNLAAARLQDEKFMLYSSI